MLPQFMSLKGEWKVFGMEIKVIYIPFRQALGLDVHSHQLECSLTPSLRYQNCTTSYLEHAIN
jgi:hypothetical protein